ncbi:MAG TPA: hypothetical protein VFQ61_16550 [Polyangiaceae bacterium]|nr:hypothetical protein [Polyangiaceae bacterium]
MAYVVNADQFKAEGAYIDWQVVARRLQIDFGGDARRVLQLRWMLHAELGLPTEPFIVWRRRKGAQEFTTLKFEVMPQSFLSGAQKVEWPEGPMLRVRLTIGSTSTGAVIAWAGSPILSNYTAVTLVQTGMTVVEISAPIIDGLLVSPGVVIQDVQGIPLDKLSDAAGWERLEFVGLPVPLPEWQGIARYDAPQGIVTALTSPQKAAVERLERGGPRVGWQPKLPSGETVPPWIAPDALHLVEKELRAGLIDLLEKVLPFTPPNQQRAKKLSVLIPPPENSSGKKMPVEDTTTQVAPLTATLMSGGCDPWLALALGFGTAYPVVLDATGAATAAGSSGLDYDYMITARWEKGLDGNSAPYEMAALVPAPSQAIAPPAPANLYTEMMGHLRPLVPDGDYRTSMKVSWDRPADAELFRPRTYAFMRASVAPAEAVRALMNLRERGGYSYPVINSALPEPVPPDWWQISDVDRELPIPSNPGTRSLRYGVAQQDIYGQWSVWSVAAGSASQPPVDKVRIVAATLQAALPVPPATSVCKGTLTIEFLWDFRIRRPEKIRFVGRLYAAAHRGDPPPINTPPSGLERSLAHSGSSLDITFLGDVPSAPGATVQLLSEDGERIVTSGADQGAETRRFRVTVPNFELDFGSTGHIGFALWALGQERIAPQRTGAWSPEPSVIAVSDPRPPKMVPDIVTLASLPDARGECHARLSWNGPGNPSNAVGYFIYESTETKILLANGLSEPPPEKTLSERLTTLYNLFDANPSKREFTRKNDKPISGTSTDITLPRGSSAIHLYLVIGVNAGQVESEWPSGPDAHERLQAIAAPRVMKPAPPTLEAVAFLDTSVSPAVHRARIRVAARPGPRVRKVQLFRVRVDDAARELDTMGPPVATITGSGGDWLVEQQTDIFGANIQRVSGLDSPSGSWKRVWYRAAAWSDADPLRGYLPGRSLESSASWVVIPPATPPDLSGVTVSWPAGGALGDVLLEWTSQAPLRKTPLGPHVLSVRVNVAGQATPLLDFRGNLEGLPTAAAASGSSVWLTTPGAPAPRGYAAYLRRASEADVLAVTIQLTDPLGRSSERVLRIGAGSVLPAPLIGKVQLRKVLTPAGTQLLFTCNAPLELVETPYVLQVTADRAATVLPLLPRILRPPQRLTVELPIPDVPKDNDANPPAGSEPLLIRRVTSSPNGRSFYAFSRVAVQRFVVRLTAPDGRSAEHIEVVS